jgi:hypothetical protein
VILAGVAFEIQARPVTDTCGTCDDGDNQNRVAFDPVNGFVWQSEDSEFAGVRHDAGASESGIILQIKDALQDAGDSALGGGGVVLRYRF